MHGIGEGILVGIILTAIIAIAIGFGVGKLTSLTKDEPTAIDVYRGKTTLEITYRDSVAIDSTVVYKVK